MAESERDFKVEQARYQQETNARQAEAELAYALQEAVTRQEIRQQEVQIEVVERTKQIEIEQQEILRRERELEANVKRPAEAERYRLETIAAGEKAQVVAGAEAEAESLTLNGTGEANAIRARGEAEADAIKAQGLAEAEAMRMKADAWKEYGQAAMIDTLLESLPDVASSVAQPLAQTDRIVMISGGDNGSIGASKLTNDVTKVVSQLPDLVESLTGIDILGTLKNLPRVATTDGVGSGAAQAAPVVEAAPVAEAPEAAEEASGEGDSGEESPA
ncbi:MAG: hypothetical protein F4152_00800 [Dehalococcoidia bacterium]|nr:hypothetical protein [Dehalococcoidia bacterium]